MNGVRCPGGTCHTMYVEAHKLVLREFVLGFPDMTNFFGYPAAQRKAYGLMALLNENIQSGHVLKYEFRKGPNSHILQLNCVSDVSDDGFDKNAFEVSGSQNNFEHFLPWELNIPLNNRTYIQELRTEVESELESNANFSSFAERYQMIYDALSFEDEDRIEITRDAEVIVGLDEVGIPGIITSFNSTNKWREWRLGMHPLNFTMPFMLDHTLIKHNIFFKIGETIVPVSLETEVLNKLKRSLSSRYGFEQEIIMEVLRHNITLMACQGKQTT